MKKTYIAPSMEVVKIQTAQLMAGSPGYGGETTETSGNLAPEYEWADWEF